MDKYNEDELVPPSWLNAQFFEQMLKSRKPNGEPKLQDLQIRPASQKGDHYASIMFRASFKYRDSATPSTDIKRECVVVKTLPDADTEKGRNLSGSHLFTTEVRVYNEVIPQFEAIWQRYGAPVQFAGRLLYAALNPHPVIVLEDLCLSGYDILRDRLFNRNEVHACLAKLAKWHAVSHKLAVEAPQQAPVTQLQHGLFAAVQLVGTDLMSGGMSNVIAALERAGGFEQYLPKLRAIEPQLIDRCQAMNNAYASGLQGPIYVLNHGDFHTKNIMIRRDDSGTLTDMLFIDFQLCFIGPSTCDLQYASYTILSREYRDKERDQFHRYYFQQYVDSLKQLEFSGRMPLYEEFEEDLKRWSCHELYMCFTILPLIGAAKPPEIDIGLLFNSAEYRETFYSNPDYIAYMRELLPKYLQLGYLD